MKMEGIITLIGINLGFLENSSDWRLGVISSMAATGIRRWNSFM